MHPCWIKVLISLKNILLTSNFLYLARTFLSKAELCMFNQTLIFLFAVGYGDLTWVQVWSCGWERREPSQTSRTHSGLSPSRVHTPLCSSDTRTADPPDAWRSLNTPIQIITDQQLIFEMSTDILHIIEYNIEKKCLYIYILHITHTVMHIYTHKYSKYT